MTLHRAGDLSFYSDLAGLSEADAFAKHLAPLRETEWVVYADPPFGGPEAMLAEPSPSPRDFHLGKISNAGHSQSVLKSCTLARIEIPSPLRTTIVGFVGPDHNLMVGGAYI